MEHIERPTDHVDRMERKHPKLVLLLRLSILVVAVLAIAAVAKPKEPLDELKAHRENYSAEQAAADGCVVVDARGIVAGRENWAAFVSASAAGTAGCEVRIYQICDGAPDHLYKELSFDGDRYLFRFYNRTQDGKEFLFRETYHNLTVSETTTEDGTFTYYLLSDSADVTADGYLETWAESKATPENAIYRKCRPALIDGAS